MDIETGVRPFGATHWSPAVRDESRLEAYWRPDGKGGYDCWAVVSGIGGYWQQIHAPLPLYAIELSAPWTGEGLPPVETVCEMRRETYFEIDWQPVTLLCVGQAKAFFRDKEGHEWSRPLRELSFRPIRTPEQIAAEERMASAYGMCAIVPTLTNVDAVALYDAGFRKKPTTKFAEGEREELINHVFKSFNVKLSEAVAIVDGGYRKPTDQ